MPKRKTKEELITTQYLTDVTTAKLAKLLNTTGSKVHKYLKGDIRVMTEQDEMILASQVKDSLYRKALGYNIDEIEVTTYYDRTGKPISDYKTGVHTQVTIKRKHVKPEISAIQMVLAKLDSGFLENGGETVKFIDDIKEGDENDNSIE